MASKILNMLPKDIELEVCKYLLPKQELDECIRELDFFFEARKFFDNYCFKCTFKMINDILHEIEPVHNRSLVTMTMIKRTDTTKYIKVCCDQCKAFNITKEYY